MKNFYRESKFDELDQNSNKRNLEGEINQFCDFIESIKRSKETT